MEWVETTGRTLEEAKEAALDQLGVDEVDAEFEIVEEPRAGLFGRVRGEARVRARVRPSAPRPKEDRRDRRRRGRGSGNGTDGAAVASGAAVAVGSGTRETGSDDTGQAGEGRHSAAVARAGSGAPGVAPTAGGDSAAGGDNRAGGEGGGGSAGEGGSSGRRRRRRGGRSRASGGSAASDGRAPEASTIPGNDDPSAGSRPGERVSPAPRSPRNANNGREDMSIDVPLEDQGRVAEEFLTGLISEFGLTATVRVTTSAEEEVKVDLAGSGLGLLIGPKGSTLLALQDLTRTAVHHKTGAGNGRIYVDVGAYRQKRSEALARFAQEVAEKVKQSGSPTALEPMAAPDRKVVHDALTSVEGVSTISEGEDPRRRVVIVPAGTKPESIGQPAPGIGRAGDHRVERPGISGADPRP